jgi:fructose-1,6-bisphosphatase I
MMADYHPNLLNGGVCIHPENAGSGKKKLRLGFECASQAMIVEQVGLLAGINGYRIICLSPFLGNLILPLDHLLK